VRHSPDLFFRQIPHFSTAYPVLGQGKAFDRNPEKANRNEFIFDPVCQFVNSNLKQCKQVRSQAIFSGLPMMVG
jgi:hypothetical protein